MLRGKGEERCTWYMTGNLGGLHRREDSELENVVRRAVEAAGLEEHQYIAVRHSEQEQERLHVAVNQIHPKTLKIHHPYKAIHAYQALASVLEEELGLRRVDRAKSPVLSYRARNFEAHHGLESFSRWARRSIGDATDLDRLRSWEALHEELTWPELRTGGVLSCGITRLPPCPDSLIFSLGVSQATLARGGGVSGGC
ncbi:MAG: relaxase/mobilization nuclease domain-containing protein [Polyangiales bacterium]